MDVSALTIGGISLSIVVLVFALVWIVRSLLQTMANKKQKVLTPTYTYTDAPQETFTEYEHRQLVQEIALYQTELQQAAITITDLQNELYRLNLAHDTYVECTNRDITNLEHQVKELHIEKLLTPETPAPAKRRVNKKAKAVNKTIDTHEVA